MSLQGIPQRLLIAIFCCSIPLSVVLLACAEPLSSPSLSVTSSQDSSQKDPSEANLTKEDPTQENAPASEEEESETTAGIPLNGVAPEGEGITQLTEEDAVWIDTNRGVVIVDGNVCLRQGVLEMFACPAGTKEHEAIVAVDSQARIVHAGLLAVGAQAGSPVQFRPEYKPATGTEVAIYVLWEDEEGHRHSVPAQHWIRRTADGSEMETTWVFAGSRLIQNQQTGLREYGADTGDLICVSNFPTATLDLPIDSSDLEDNLLFEAFTEHVPAVDTPVRLVLVPQFEAAPAEGEAAPEDE